ncbi:MAG: DUF3306 domain-containing protein [Betaproteobacteria bacterium]|nr:DUF3306 domain-containing protein [Betaproteobacteria bacterium]
MARDEEAFLSRWSRLKREEAAKPETPAAPAPAADDDPAPPLPPVEGLTPESDFTPFMHAKVPVETRRAALKKLFSDPQFSVPDVNEAYSGDWTVGEPISPELLKTLNQAKRILFDELPPADNPPAEELPPGDQPADTVAKEDNAIGRQDT